MLRTEYIERMVAAQFQHAVDYLEKPPAEPALRSIWVMTWGVVAENLFTPAQKAVFTNLVIRFLPKGGMDATANNVAFCDFLTTHGAELFNVGNRCLVRFLDQETGDRRYYLVGTSDEILRPSHFGTCMASHCEDDKFLALGGWDMLLTLLHKLEKRIRRKAADDYDYACAVTADGRDMIHADRVWIVKPDLTYTEVDVTKFQPRKVTLIDNYCVTSTPDPMRDTRSVLIMAGFGGRTPAMVHITPPTDQEGAFPSIFAISEELVPHNLL